MSRSAAACLVCNRSESKLCADQPGRVQSEGIQSILTAASSNSRSRTDAASVRNSGIPSTVFVVSTDSTGSGEGVLCR